MDAKAERMRDERVVALGFGVRPIEWCRRRHAATSRSKTTPNLAFRGGFEQGV